MSCLDCGAECLHDDDMDYLLAHSDCDECGGTHCLDQCHIGTDGFATLILCSTCAPAYIELHPNNNEGDQRHA